jgi:hypothetical protein
MTMDVACVRENYWYLGGLEPLYQLSVKDFQNNGIKENTLKGVSMHGFEIVGRFLV